MVDFDLPRSKAGTILLSLPFQENRLCLTIDFV
jgi:hypothetical protein